MARKKISCGKNYPLKQFFVIGNYEKDAGQKRFLKLKSFNVMSFFKENSNVEKVQKIV